MKIRSSDKVSPLPSADTRHRTQYAWFGGPGRALSNCVTRVGNLLQRGVPNRNGECQCFGFPPSWKYPLAQAAHPSDTDPPAHPAHQPPAMSDAADGHLKLARHTPSTIMYFLEPGPRT